MQYKIKSTKIKIMFSFIVDFVKINFFRDQLLAHSCDHVLISESIRKECKCSVLYQGSTHLTNRLVKN